MSKLYNMYLKLKSNNPNKIYLFKSGIFYTALDSDARLLSSKTGLKLTNLNGDVMKCSFPTTSMLKYSNLLIQFNIDFDVIEDYFNSVNCQKYISNIYLSDFITKFSKLDLDHISISEAYELLYELKDVLTHVEEL